MRSTSNTRWLAITLAVAVTFAVLVPFFAAYNHAAAPSKIASLFGDTILICTGDGFALVKRADLHSQKAPVKQHLGYACALCYVSAHSMGKALLAAAIIVFLFHKAAGRTRLFLRRVRLEPFFYNTPSPRAPPRSFCC